VQFHIAIPVDGDFNLVQFHGSTIDQMKDPCQ
jgi:hypothetical protein